MKKIAFSLLWIFSAALFYSCSNDAPTAPAGTSDSTYTWTLYMNNILVETVNGIVIGDDNTIFARHVPACYKVTNGTRTLIDFQDSLFSPDVIDAYSGSYYAAAGNVFNSIYDMRLKIFDGSTLTHITLGDSAFSDAKGINIFSPGKIAVYSNSKIYFYDNGSVLEFASPDSFYTHFNNLVQSGNIYYINGSVKKVYKLENNSLSTINTVSGSGEFGRMSIPGYIIRDESLTASSQVSYWSGSEWNTLFTDNLRRVYYSASGENINSIYFLAADSTISFSQGIIFAGGRLKADVNFPADNPSQNLYTSAISNMKNGTIYLAKSDGLITKIYKGVKNF